MKKSISAGIVILVGSLFIPNPWFLPVWIIGCGLVIIPLIVKLFKI